MVPDSSEGLVPFQFHRGTNAVLVSIPHAGTHVPATIADRMTASARALPDTDWHLDQLYGWVVERGVSLITATHSRYVVDLNRPPDDARLYETTTTGLFPTLQFDGNPIYQAGQQPTEAERVERTRTFYDPYHAKVFETLKQLRNEFGYAVLFDAHSILSRVPRLFDGVLPDFNIGSNDGHSAETTLIERLCEVCASVPEYSQVLNGRFKGGYITRHYGQPQQHIHAVQLELSQCTYMQEDGLANYDEALAAQVQKVLRRWVSELVDWRP